MAVTQADLDALDAAIVSGTKRVHFQDRTVEYQDLKSMLEAKTMLYLQLNPAGTVPPVKRQTRMYSAKGL